MAVQAQYPSNVLLINRGEQEMKAVDYSQTPQAFLDQPAVFFSNGASANPRKRGREAVTPAVVPIVTHAQQSHPINLFSMQPQASISQSVSPPALTSLAQLQTQPPPTISTGLRLAFEDHQHQQQQKHHPPSNSQNQSNLLLSSSSTSSSLLSSLLSDDLANQINQQRGELDHFLQAQGEQLRRTLAERRRRHYHALIAAAEAAATRRLREKEAEVERATRRGAELEDRLARLRAETVAWQAKAMADQAIAASLHAQLQQAAAAAQPTGPAECAEPAADDAESANIDPGRAEMERLPGAACRTCRARPASVVLLPCRHLSLCAACDSSAAGEPCPVCRCPRSGSVQVFLS